MEKFVTILKPISFFKKTKSKFRTGLIKKLSAFRDGKVGKNFVKNKKLNQAKWSRLGHCRYCSKLYWKLETKLQIPASALKTEALQR